MKKSKFAEKIIELRKEHKYTQKHVAQEIGLTTRQYQYLESGHFTCKYENLVRLCKLYGVSSDELLGIGIILVYPDVD